MATSSRTHTALVMKKVDGKPGEVWYPLHLLTIPTPHPTPSQLLLRPTHLALNHRDLFLRQALYPAPSFTTPLLADAVCLVLSPTTHTPLLPPRRVLLNPGHGWLTDPLGPEGPYSILGGTATNPLGVAQDLLVVATDEVVPCPAHLTSPQAAALPLCGLTAWRALVAKSGVVDRNAQGTYSAAGKHVLVTGIGGGVALMVLLLATAMGARVWVTSGEAAKLAKAKTLGAEGGVSYRDKAWERNLKSQLPPSRPYLDAIIDGAGGDIVAKGARLLRGGGVVVSYGMTLEPVLAVPMLAVMANLEVRGSTMGSRREFGEMVAFVAERGVVPVVEGVVNGGLGNLEGVEGMFGRMRDGGQFGKLVLEMEAGGGGSRL